MNEFQNYFSGDFLIVQVVIVILFTSFADFLQRTISGRLLDRLQKTPLYWDDALVNAARRPLIFLVWLIGLSFASDIVTNEGTTFILNAIDVVRGLGIVLIFVWFLLGFIQGTEKNVVLKKASRGESVDRTLVNVVAKSSKFCVIIIAIIVALQTLGYSVNSMLAFGGMGGVVVGFAAKDLLANIFGGLLLYIERPFAIGDWIRSPDRDIEGTVEDIGWRLTQIRTFDQRPLYVPNSVFNSIAIENPSRMTNRRIKEVIGIRYADADKMRLIVADVKQMLQEHEDIDSTQTLIVNLDRFAPSSLDFFIYTFTKTTEWIRFHEIKQDVLLKIIDIIDSHGAECAFPTSTLHIADTLSVNPVN